MADFASYQKLVRSSIFKSWKKKHPKAYLSHFYCQLDSEFVLKGDWEAGFYEPDKDKIVIFVVGEEITLKPEEEVFKKEGKVDKLELEKIKIEMNQALESVKKTKEECYPKELLCSGFLVLQNFQNRLMWNVSFATKSMQIINIKIDATRGEVISHQLINFIEKSAA